MELLCECVRNERPDKSTRQVEDEWNYEPSTNCFSDEFNADPSDNESRNDPSDLKVCHNFSLSAK
jgi:hypothetical protein